MNQQAGVLKEMYHAQEVKVEVWQAQGLSKPQSEFKDILGNLVECHLKRTRKKKTGFF